jgi:ribosomal protein S18 acetylase RimI-like enzyme
MNAPLRRIIAIGFDVWESGVQTKAMRLTPIKPDHWATLEPMMREFWAFEKMPFSSDAALKVWQKAWTQPEFVRGWLLEFESEVVGYVVLTFGFSLEYGGLDAYIDELFVKPECRGRGFATRAMQFLELECQHSNVNTLHLEVDADNYKAKALYAKSGFESTGRELLNKVIF